MGKAAAATTTAVPRASATAARVARRTPTATTTASAPRAIAAREGHWRRGIVAAAAMAIAATIVTTSVGGHTLRRLLDLPPLSKVEEAASGQRDRRALEASHVSATACPTFAPRRAGSRGKLSAAAANALEWSPLPLHSVTPHRATHTRTDVGPPCSRAHASTLVTCGHHAFSRASGCEFPISLLGFWVRLDSGCGSIRARCRLRDVPR
jgi:hypothetical protein